MPTLRRHCCHFKRVANLRRFSIEGVIQYWAVGRREDDTHMYIIASKEVGLQ